MRPRRVDEPGAWWLITNRGLAKRPVFETEQDVERFLGFLGEAVARGEIEVHAFTIMTNHFHLLVRSLRGRISEAMGRVTNSYVRWFNRSRRRDGPLFRGRFDGRRIRDPAQWEAALRYIDRNPVRARMVERASDHPHGSARAYRFGTGPEWLARGEVEHVVRDAFARERFVPSDIDRFAAAADDEVVAHLIEHAQRSPRRPLPALADLVRSASDRQQGWMEWKTVLADAMTPGTAFLSPRAARRAARVAARALRARSRPPSRSDVERDLEAALLRHAAGLTLREIADELVLSPSAIEGALRRHELRMTDVVGYDELVTRALRSAVRKAFPAHGRGTHLAVRMGVSANETLRLPGV
jgi:REP element-mobilizing transposase RayT